jgi:hypothetical protein
VRRHVTKARIKIGGDRSDHGKHEYRRSVAAVDLGVYLLGVGWCSCAGVRCRQWTFRLAATRQDSDGDAR